MIARMAYPHPPPGDHRWNQPPSPPGFYPPMYPPPRQTNAMAIAALVSAFVIAPLGIVFGHIALSQIRRSDEDGRGLAIAGLVIGYVFTGLYLLLIVLWVAMFAWITTEIEKLPTTTTRYGTYSMQSTAWTEKTPVLCLVTQSQPR
jgi:peptidyl-prolyl cis-trans isomerase B (cyclophilin B)